MRKGVKIWKEVDEMKTCLKRKHEQKEQNKIEEKNWTQQSKI